MHIILIAICTDPCINGGTCTEPDVCQCPEPYGGVTCADSTSITALLIDAVIIFLLVICNSNFCANGGTCEVSLVGLTCRWVENTY